ncbi:MAG TPA: class IV adenylate cyclase [Tepidisphaeraceae bacterium]|nr:class IV adenylate cyclase [Tepidisphaeraceae bacterium]
MQAKRNIELKARCRDLARAARAALEAGAERAGLLVQCDTYFRVPNGRLKLRETDGRPAELIWYARPNDPADRGSDYYVLPTPAPAETKAALTRALGVRGEVRKRRELLLWHNVRIHLDDVAGLGTFLEFEAVVSDSADEAVSRQRLRSLTERLGIQQADRVALSYSDLLGI